MHVFPDAHPRARKAQVDVDAPDAAVFPLSEALGPPDVDVVLEPGDAVAIPAFSFHHCEALDASASVNAFFPAETRAVTKIHIIFKM